MGPIEQGVLVTLGIFVAGLVYHAGRMSARLESTERSIEKLEREVRGGIAELKAMLTPFVGRRHDDPRDE